MSVPVFHRNLISYINSGCLKRRDILISLFCPALPFFLNAKKVAEMFNQAIGIKKERKEKERKDVYNYKVSLEPYKNPGPGLKALRNFLLDTLTHDLYGAYIHGSMATDEIINYSDVDALIIIKDEVFQNTSRLARVAYQLNRALKYFYKIDPLQHHGWFVLTETTLECHDQNYFPIELFKYSKSLLPDKGLNIKLFFDPEEQDYQTPFINLAIGIRWQLENEYYPRNMYQLKGLLSRFMLLPALYCQARDRKGVFKKFSFDAARKDFPDPVWSIMDEVSDIRLDWHYLLNPAQKYLMSRKSPLLIRLKRKIGPKIPADLKRELSGDFYERILNLIDQMENKLR